MDKYIKDFLSYLKNQRNYSLKTIDSYKEDLKILEDFYLKENINFLKVEYSDIRFLYNYLDSKKYSKNTIARMISSTRSFYKYLAFNKIIEINPFSLATLPKKDKLLPKFLYYNELEELFDTFDLKDKYGQRDRLILELLYATGLRVSELVNIKLDDIDYSDNHIKVLGKGNKERIVYFGEYAKTYLELYLNDGRKNLLKKECNYLFINNKSGKLSARGVELIIDKVIKKTSIKTKVTPHTIRHTFATHLLNEGCDISTVQELLGHESLKATQIYTHITNDSLRNTYLKTHPRNNKY